MKDPIVTVKNLTVAFDGKKVLEKINFQIYQGEYVGLIGPNGAGKSTLLKSILGLVKSNTGCVEIKPRTSIGYVPQQGFYGNYFSFSVKEILGMAMKRRSIFYSAGEGKVMGQKLAAVGLKESFLKKNFYNLSMGERQRVVIARSLINEPHLLLFDEPLGTVDYKTKILIYNLLDELRENFKISILFVSHEIEKIVDKCHRILCLDKKLYTDCHAVDFSKGEICPSKKSQPEHWMQKTLEKKILAKKILAKKNLEKSTSDLLPIHHHH